MVDWPSDLANVLKLTGATDQRVGAKIRSDVEVGPAIVRRRYTTSIRNVSIPVVMTHAERAIFDAFYVDDLVEGTLSFNWVDPKDDTTVSFRFRSEEGPTFTVSGAGDNRRWSATLDLEVLP
jgi:hypothetical protein